MNLAKNNFNSFCKSCRKPIIWTVNHRTGKKMPVDVEHVANGNVYVQFSSNGSMPISLVGNPKFLRVDLVTNSHFASCKYASVHRRKR